MENNYFNKENKVIFEQELIKNICNNQLDDFTKLLQLYRPTLERYATKYSYQSSFEKDDFFQEGLLALYRAALSYNKDSGATYATYATRCIEHAMIDLARKHKRVTSLHTIPFEDSTVSSVDTMEQGNLLENGVQHIHQVLKKYRQLLSPFEFQVLQHYLMGYTYKEISMEIGSTEKAIDNALQRVKRKLRLNHT